MYIIQVALAALLPPTITGQVQRLRNGHSTLMHTKEMALEKLKELEWGTVKRPGAQFIKEANVLASRSNGKFLTSDAKEYSMPFDNRSGSLPPFSGSGSMPESPWDHDDNYYYNTWDHGFDPGFDPYKTKDDDDYYKWHPSPDYGPDEYDPYENPDNEGFDPYASGSMPPGPGRYDPYENPDNGGFDPYAAGSMPPGYPGDYGSMPPASPHQWAVGAYVKAE